MYNSEQKEHSGFSSPNCGKHIVMPSCLSHGSLFSGIGGFDLAASWMGWNNVFQCEKDEWCRKVLAKNFPNTKRHTDIKEFNAKEYHGTIDVISGGFPCQPFSVAGKRKGKGDDRYLWEEMLRVIGEVAPAFVVGENVTGIIGMALDTVLSDLEAQGYTTETFVIPACGKNAWHRRDRVWFVAYAHSFGRQDEQEENGKLVCDGKRNDKTKEQSGEQQQRRISEPSFIPNAKSFRERPGKQSKRNVGRVEQLESTRQRSDINNLCEANGSEWWETEPELGRVANGIPDRVDRLKGLGNAIVPQVAFELFKAVESVHRHGA